ncbi:Ectonucleotide pyrophosphatase/phosphodiesterase family member [Trichinella pseudospiralis]
MNKSFNYFVDTSSTDAAFFSGIPLWQLNDDATGLNRRSGCMMWSCAEVDLLVHRRKRSDHFGLLYIEEPDKIGHEVGPDSPKISQMVERLDVLTGYLLMRLNEEHLLDRMNFIFTSDHGMASVPKMNSIRLDSFLDNSSYKFLAIHQI